MYLQNRGAIIVEEVLMFVFETKLNENDDGAMVIKVMVRSSMWKLYNSTATRDVAALHNGYRLSFNYSLSN